MAKKKDPTQPARQPARERYALFVAEYLANGRNATQAALKVGYSPHTADVQAARLLGNVIVKDMIEKATKNLLEEKKVDQEWVVDVILETINRCRQAEAVLDRKGNQILIENRDGEFVPAFIFNAKGVLMGTDQLGRWLKMFTDKLELNNPPGQPLEITNMTLEEAARIYQDMLKKS